MERWEQFEIWAPGSGEAKWQFVAAFNDFDVASAVAKARGSDVRLIQATYTDGKLTSRQVILDLGKTRHSA